MLKNLPFSGPAVKHLFLQYPNIKITDIQGTGKGGRITKTDFLNFQENLKNTNSNTNKVTSKGMNLNTKIKYEDIKQNEIQMNQALNSVKSKKTKAYGYMNLEVEVEKELLKEEIEKMIKQVIPNNNLEVTNKFESKGIIKPSNILTFNIDPVTFKIILNNEKLEKKKFMNFTISYDENEIETSKLAEYLEKFQKRLEMFN